MLRIMNAKKRMGYTLTTVASCKLSCSGKEMHQKVRGKCRLVLLIEPKAFFKILVSIASIFP